MWEVSAGQVLGDYVPCGGKSSEHSQRSQEAKCPSYASLCKVAGTWRRGGTWMFVPMPQLHSVLYRLREAGTMSAEEEEKSEDMPKADKVHYEREMNTYIAAKRRPKRSSKIQCTQAASFCLLLILF